jgi:membrane-associated phospholipid phosphatase
MRYNEHDRIMLTQLIALGLLAAVSMLLFFPTNNSNWPLRESKIVGHIPFVPAFIVPYLGLFPYIAFSMLAVLLFTPIAARLYVSLIFGGVVSALVWYFMPTGTPGRPQFIPKGPFTKTVAWMYNTDPGGNALPSSHTYTALVCSYYLAFAFPIHDILIWSCGAVIVSSTLFVKQHHLSDLLAGMALAAVSIGFSYLILGGI